MGSVCDMNNAKRSAAVMQEAKGFLAGLKGLIGATVIDVGVEINEPIGTVKAFFRFQLPDGKQMSEDGPLLAEVTDGGICGFSLEESYEEAELRKMIEAAIANRENGLDDDDRERLGEELDELSNYYG